MARYEFLYTEQVEEFSFWVHFDPVNARMNSSYATQTFYIHFFNLKFHWKKHMVNPL